MHLCTLVGEGRDGRLAVASRDHRRACLAEGIAPTLQAALDRWADSAPKLQALADDLEAGKAKAAFDLDAAALMAPLPRAYQMLDGSAYTEHMVPIRKARGAALPPGYFDTPILYQCLSDPILGPTDDVPLPRDRDLGIDFEAELVVITDDVPMGIRADAALGHVALVGLLNDVSLRALLPGEVARGFGLVLGKSADSMAPFVVTPDELGADWAGGRLSGTYLCEVNGRRIGTLDPGKGQAFGYDELIAYGAQTRALRAGTVIGAGAIANGEGDCGCGCLAELRAREQLAGRTDLTPLLTFGDEVYLEMFGSDGRSPFGAIRSRIAALP